MFFVRCSCCPVRSRIQGCISQQLPDSAQLCGAMRDRSRSCSPWRGSIRQLQPAARGHPRPQVQWLIEDGMRRWREVLQSMAERLEEQWRSDVEVAVLEEHLEFPGVTQGCFYTHMMINQDRAVMTQTKFEDPERQTNIYTKRLVRVIMQTSRRDKCRSSSPPRA